MIRLRQQLPLMILLACFACLALVAAQCPELSCHGCSADEVATHQSVHLVLTAAVTPSLAQVEAPMVLDRSTSVARSQSSSEKHPALIARLVV